jgi:glutamyl-tRNA synthetase
LRTALAAWASAISAGGSFLVRWEDLDQFTATRDHAVGQLRDLASLGMEPGATPVLQSERLALYHDAIASLVERGLTYECFCSRKDIRDAVAAPHGQFALYPGTCRSLSESERDARRQERPGALRLRANGGVETFTDYLHGTVSGEIDDVVLRRNDGMPSYNVAVVVDDALQNVSEVVRGDDLLGITPSQVYLQKLLGYETPIYGHVPLVVGDDGERLAKRHGAVTLRHLADLGVSAAEVRDKLWESLGQQTETWNWNAVPRTPWVSTF